jgi:hypothetical protein
MPSVTQSTECLLFLPVANALGRPVGATATRGLSMSASAHSRSTIACSSGACFGDTSRAPAAASAILSLKNSETNAEPPPNTSATKMIAPALAWA